MCIAPSFALHTGLFCYFSAAITASIDLGIALPPDRYHSKAALALRDVFFRILQN